jgi:hypothetical protein
MRSCRWLASSHSGEYNQLSPTLLAAQVRFYLSQLMAVLASNPHGREIEPFDRPRGAPEQLGELTLR